MINLQKLKNETIMKRICILFFVVLFTTSLVGQNQTDIRLSPANSLLLNHKAANANDLTTKTLACIDTLRYPQVKEQVLGTPTFYSIDFWQEDQEGISQTFLLSGATISIQGIDFFGRAVPLSVMPLTVTGSIYNVDGNNNPTTLIGSATTVISDTVWQYRQIVFSTPLTVNSNYAVVVEPTSLNGKLFLYVNDAAPGQVWDENLSRGKSNWYAPGQGWVSIPVYTAGFTGGPYDFEALLAPMITYTINTDFFATPNPVCMGEQVTFTSTTTPMSVLTNRMYNYRAFNSYFLSYPDSLFAWDPDETAPPFIYNSSIINHTYSGSGNVDAFLATLGGFWDLCIDSKVNQVTVNPLPSVSLGAFSPVCVNATPFTLTGGNPSGGTYSGTGVSGGNFDPAAAPTGSTITYTYSDGNGCTNSAVQNITVNPLPVVSLALTPNIVCDYTPAYMLTGGSPSGGDYSGTGITAGQFDPSVAGIGTHIVTYSYTDGNNCSSSANDNIVVDACTQIHTDETAALFISPNPASDYLSISLQNLTNEQVHVSIFAPDGKIIWSDISSESHYLNTIDLSGFAGGTYLVSVKTQQEVYNTKLVIIK